MPPRRSIKTAERDGEAARLRARGLTYREIGDRLGMAPQSAHEAVQRALVEAVREPADEVRALELARLDALLAHAWAVLERYHVTVQQGRLVLDPDGDPIPDDGPVLAAIDRVLKIQDRRARYLGLDAPVRHEVLTLDAVDAEIARLTRELGGRDVLDARPGQAGAAAPAEDAPGPG